MSDTSTPPYEAPEMQAQKRKASQAGLDNPVQTRSVKRRASKACQCCRARKVRCNVTEHGAPCTNCRLDEVDCIVSESRRKKSVTSTALQIFTSRFHMPDLQVGIYSAGHIFREYVTKLDQNLRIAVVLTLH
jgi:hypothetical protein